MKSNSEPNWEEYAERVHLDESLYEHDTMHQQRMLELSARAQGDVLDAACGDGYLLYLLKRMGKPFKELFGLDISTRRVFNVREKYDLHADQGDIRAMPYADKSFDTSIGSEILEHLENPGMGLKELFRVARDRVVITVPIGDFHDDTHKWMVSYKLVPNDKPDELKAGEGELLIQFDRIK